MVKTKSKKIFIICIITVTVLAAFSFGIYKYNRMKDYNMLISNANKYMNSKEYDKAISLFEQSLNYKKDPNIEKNIVLASRLKKVKEIYDNGIGLMKDKKYLEAIKKFKTIKKDSLKWYSYSQQKIQECKKKFIVQNIKLANGAVKSNNYDKAKKHLDDILKLDSNNSEAKILKDRLDKSAKEQQEKDRAIKEQKEKDRVIKEQQEQVQKSSSETIQDESPQNSNYNNNNPQYNQYAMEIQSLEKRKIEIDTELTHLYKYSDEYINKLEEKRNLIYQQQEIIQKMKNISDN
ncbi:tetratricopeptide repeat protein [Clostridium botulinum]|nr:tetratricopeptide repeat protein [Clostridium botulinum]